MPSLSGKCGCERFIARLKLSYETNGYERAKCLLMIYINTIIFIVDICMTTPKNTPYSLNYLLTTNAHISTSSLLDTIDQQHE